MASSMEGENMTTVVFIVVITDTASVDIADGTLVLDDDVCLRAPGDHSSTAELVEKWLC